MLDERLCYPRLFASENDRAAPIEANLEPFPEIAASFAALTGWTLGYRETSDSRVRREGIGCRDLPRQARIVIDDLSEDAIRGSMRAIHREKCERLVAGINSILEELDRCREDVWRKNAELATGIPVTDDGSSGEKLAVLLNSLLTSAIDVSNAKQSAIYVLDDGTQNLNLRTTAGFNQHSTPASSRDLSRAKADLEALLGHAVVIEDASRYTSWNLPTGCGSAMCVPIASSSNLLGTLWIFDDKPRAFGGPEVNMVEIIAGRIAAELERCALLQVARAAKSESKRLDAADSVARPQLPNIHPPIDELKIRGEVFDAADVAAGSVYDWAICQQGRLAVLVAHAGGSANHAARVATILQTAFRAHSGHCGTALELFDSVFETAMSVGSSEDPVRFTCGYIDPSSGRCDLASTEQRPGAVTVSDNEFQVNIAGSPNANGEFGLAHLAQIALEPADELAIAIANSCERTLQNGAECDLPTSEPRRFDPDPVERTDPPGLATLRIKWVHQPVADFAL